MRLSYHIARGLNGDELHARLYCSGKGVGCSWVGFGFANVPGRMIGSKVVIGIRDVTGMSATPPLRKYVLSSKSPSGVTPMADSLQTLEDTELSDVDEGGNEVGLLAAFMLRLSTAEGMNPVDLSRAFLVYAHGNHETVSYHGVVNRNHLVVDLVHQPRVEEISPPPPPPPSPSPALPLPPSHPPEMPPSCDIKSGGPSHARAPLYGTYGDSEEDEPIFDVMTDLVVASKEIQRDWECTLSLSAGAHTIELGYRLDGRTIFAEVRCPTCQSWIAFGFTPESMKLSGGGAVIGWLDGFASPHFVGKFLVEDKLIEGQTRPVASLMHFEDQTLRETSIEREKNGGLMMSFTATIGEHGLPGAPLTYTNLFAAVGNVPGSGSATVLLGNDKVQVGADLLAATMHANPPSPPPIRPPPSPISPPSPSPPPFSSPPPTAGPPPDPPEPSPPPSLPACGTHGQESGEPRYTCMVSLARGVELHFGIVFRTFSGLLKCATSECPNWLGLGFPSEPGKMIGALAVVLHPGEKNEVKLLRLHAKHPEAVVEAEEEDRQLWKLRDAAGELFDGHSGMHFTIDLPSQVELDAMHLIFAGGRGESLTYHGTSRGHMTLNLLGYHYRYDYLPPPAAPSSETFGLLGGQNWLSSAQACADHRLSPLAGYPCSLLLDGWLEVHYRLHGITGENATLDAHMECASCTGWLGFGFGLEGGEATGSTVVIGAGTPALVELYYVRGPGVAGVQQLPTQEQRLTGTRFNVHAPRGISMAFSAPLGGSGFPEDLSVAHLVYASGVTRVLGGWEQATRSGATSTSLYSEAQLLPRPLNMSSLPTGGTAVRLGDDGLAGGWFALIGAVIGLAIAALVFGIARTEYFLKLNPTRAAEGYKTASQSPPSAVPPPTGPPPADPGQISTVAVDVSSPRHTEHMMTASL